MPDSIQLWDNNPYVSGNVFAYPEGDFTLSRTPLVYVKSPKDKSYTVKEGDDLWSIAGDKEAYGDAKLYWVLADVNNIEMALDITIGTVLIIPDLDFLFANQPQV